VIPMLQALVEHFTDRPYAMAVPGPSDSGIGVAAGSDAAMRAAVTYVAGMTDRFACLSAVAKLGWNPSRLPHSVSAP
jgi:dGTPase